MRRTRRPVTATAGPAATSWATPAKKLERKEGVFQIYFTGCGGDITVGKYNDGSRKCREELAARLLAGMEAAVAATKLVPAGPVRWRTYPLLLPRRTDPGFSLAECLARMKDPKTRSGYAAVCAARARGLPPAKRAADRVEFAGNRQRAHRASAGRADDLTSSCSRRASSRQAFVAVAGYGDCGPGYICPEQAYRDGGYEPTASRT